MSDDSAKARSATQLIRAQQAEEGRRAMAEYEARAAFVRANTERLRALRLAQEAAQPPKPVEAKAKLAANGEGKMKHGANGKGKIKPTAQTAAKKPAKRKAPAA